MATESHVHKPLWLKIPRQIDLPFDNVAPSSTRTDNNLISRSQHLDSTCTAVSRHTTSLHGVPTGSSDERSDIEVSARSYDRRAQAPCTKLNLGNQCIKKSAVVLSARKQATDFAMFGTHGGPTILSSPGTNGSGNPKRRLHPLWADGTPHPMGLAVGYCALWARFHICLQQLTAAILQN